MRELTADTIIRVKASRPSLTGDTRIQLRQIKDLKEWVEDRKIYKPGDISQKTGLQKQPDGSWKEPKGPQRTRTLHSEAKEEGAAAGTEEDVELTEEQKKKTKEIETRINAAGWFKHPSTLDGMHPEAAKAVEEQCTRIFKEFPKLKGFIEGLKIRRFPAEERNAFAKCEGTGKSAYIVFNQDYYSDKAKLDKLYEQSVKDNYHPQGTTSDSLVIHEIAHCMCDYLANKKSVHFDDYCREVVIDVFKEFQAEGIEFDVSNGLGDYPGDIEQCPTSEIQMAELIADAYAEYKSSMSPRKIARHIGKRLEGECK